MQVQADHSFRSLAIGGYGDCGVDQAGAGWCWGSNSHGARGDGSSSTDSVATATAVAGGLTFASLTGGENGFCARTVAGLAYCWGANQWGDVGDGAADGNMYTHDRGVPTLVAGGYAWKQVDTGYGHSCGVTSTGTAKCWGIDFQGQIGNGAGGGYTITPSPSSVAAPA